MIEELKPEINETIVRILKENLELAEKGKINSIVIIGTRDDTRTFNQYVLNNQLEKILGAIRITERDMIDTHGNLRKNISWDYCE